MKILLSIYQNTLSQKSQIKLIQNYKEASKCRSIYIGLHPINYVDFTLKCV